MIKLISLALVVALGAGGALAANKALELPESEKAPLTKARYEAARAAIDRQFGVAEKTCERLRGNAQDVCHAQAKGRQEAKRAQLEARYRPSPETVEAAKFAIAEANFDVAKEKCDALEGRAARRCMKEARAAREAARRQARVEKVESTGGIYGDGAAGKAAAKPPRS